MSQHLYSFTSLTTSAASSSVIAGLTGRLSSSSAIRSVSGRCNRGLFHASLS